MLDDAGNSGCLGYGRGWSQRTQCLPSTAQMFFIGVLEGVLGRRSVAKGEGACGANAANPFGFDLVDTN